MATTEMNCLVGGGGFSDVISPTISGATISAEWDYDAEAILLIYEISGVKSVFMYSVASPSNLWYCNTSGAWTNYGNDTRVTVTARSFSANYGSGTITNASVIPLTSKPSGYYS